MSSDIYIYRTMQRSEMTIFTRQIPFQLSGQYATDVSVGTASYPTIRIQKQFVIGVETA